MNKDHATSAELFLKDKEGAQWHNNTLWFTREKRDKLVMDIPEWEELRELASKIKMHTVTHLDTYLEQFAEAAEKNGAIIHWAKDASEYNNSVLELLRKHNVTKLVKSKSMLTEECLLDDFLLEKGINVIESDLGERILQLMQVPPSHIVMPAIHLKRQLIGKLFEEKLHTEEGNSDPTYLTGCMRENLRQEFLSTEVAMTGANFGIAETGEVVVCTNEGNADMGTSLANVHIVSMGIEKVIPNHDSLGIFTRLLARSATGQPVTSYTSHYQKPRKGGELHIILVDNGRSNILGNKDHIQTLKCIRCGACMNTCPVYRRSGGYSYSFFIPGPIGINLGMLKDPEKYYTNLQACSLCFSCNNVCPVKIDLGNQIYKWRQGLDAMGKANPAKKLLSSGMGYLFKHPVLFHTALRVAPVVNKLPRPLVYNSLNQWGIGREIPHFAGQSFTSWWKNKDKK